MILGWEEVELGLNMDTFCGSGSGKLSISIKWCSYVWTVCDKLAARVDISLKMWRLNIHICWRKHA